MAEKSPQKTVGITIKRKRPTAPKFLVATGFRLRSDKSSGLVEVLLEASGQRGERITLDPVVIGSNLQILKQYAAGLAYPEDDGAQKDDIAAGETSAFANILHISQMGGRAETIFGVFSMSDWAEATRQTRSDAMEITSYDTVVAMSTTGFQKKLLLELVLMLHQHEPV
jgi:hypothetical protein